ncbi:unnamed protein product [Taenia asiatica]|uniref:DUF5726 domain-containing protein n=1 Tax=Taenia asiatica TaxID=60517 RepID=A0A0R3W2K9_TAEAS|nr:unnamed protein product [Taenia asiatica]
MHPGAGGQFQRGRGRTFLPSEVEDSLYTDAALADLLHFKDGGNFEDWMKTARFYIYLYPQRQRVPLILHALPQELFLAAVDAGVTADSDIDHCCEILTQLTINQREQSLAKDFFHRDQKAGDNDEEHARDL